MIITIGGKPGSGKSVVGEGLSEILGFEYIDVGGLRRVAAADQGMTIEAFNEWSELNPVEGDNFFDDYIRATVGKKKNAIVVGRLAFWTLPQSLKVFLDVSADVGAKRIFDVKQLSDARNEDVAETLETQKKLVADRISSDSKRYLKAYGVDCYDTSKFDVVIDTSNIGITDVIQAILGHVKKV
jgi:cytidylate kinase